MNIQFFILLEFISNNIKFDLPKIMDSDTQVNQDVGGNSYDKKSKYYRKKYSGDYV